MKKFPRMKASPEDTIKTVLDQEENELPYSEYQPTIHFCLLSLFSFGLYPFFWFYKHWQFLRDEKKMDINPSFRTVLTFFYGYSLFKHFYAFALTKGYKSRPPFEILFLLYIVFAFMIHLKVSLLPFLSIVSFVFLIPIHNMMNFYYLHEQAEHQIRVKMGKGEKTFLIVFWTFILLVFLKSVF